MGLTNEDIGFEPVFDEADKAPKKKKLKNASETKQEWTHIVDEEVVEKKGKKAKLTIERPEFSAPQEPLEESRKKKKRKSAPTASTDLDNEAPKKKKKKRVHLTENGELVDKSGNKTLSLKEKRKLIKKKNQETEHQKDSVFSLQIKTKTMKKPQVEGSNIISEDEEEDGEAERKQNINDQIKPKVEQKHGLSQTEKAAIDEKFKDVLEKLSNVIMEDEAQNIVNAEIESGRLKEEDRQVVLQRYRQLKRKRALDERINSVVEMSGTLDEVKRMVNVMVKQKAIKRYEAGDIISKWRNRERRRLGRQVDKQTNLTCFNCRQPGHVLAECPDVVGGIKTEGAKDSGTPNMCFKCGSFEHDIYKCPKKHIRGFPFATCFICEQTGHLSRDCEKNLKGIYPDGGSCNVCGSNKHLKKDCPELAAQKQQHIEKQAVVRTMLATESADVDYDPTEHKPPPTQPSKTTKKQKIVKF